MKKIEINKPVKFLAISWYEPTWEFGHPCVLLEPFVRCYQDGESLDSIIECAQIDAAIGLDTLKKGNIPRDSDNIRQYSISYLKKTAQQVLKGKEFPVKMYDALEINCVFKWTQDTYPDGSIDAYVEWENVE